MRQLPITAATWKSIRDACDDEGTKEDAQVDFSLPPQEPTVSGSTVNIFSTVVMALLRSPPSYSLSENVMYESAHGW